jgi:hypothetical protein
LELIYHILTTKVKNRGGSKLEHFTKEETLLNCFCSLNQTYICGEVSQGKAFNWKEALYVIGIHGKVSHHYHTNLLNSRKHYNKQPV